MPDLFLFFVLLNSNQDFYHFATCQEEWEALSAIAAEIALTDSISSQISGLH